MPVKMCHRHCTILSPDRIIRIRSGLLYLSDIPTILLNGHPGRLYRQALPVRWPSSRILACIFYVLLDPASRISSGSHVSPVYRPVG